MVSYTVGWVYNLVDPAATTSAGSLIAIAITFAVIAFLAVALRLYVRLGKQRNGLHLDDWVILVSLVICVAHSGVITYQTRWGQALSPQFFPRQNLENFLKVQYAGGMMYTVALLGFKLSLLASYHRIGGFNRTLRMVLYVVTVLIIVSQVAMILLLALGCQPVPKYWRPFMPGKCINNVAAYFALGALDIFFDIVIIILPMPVIAKLQLPLRKKLGLAAMFALGLFITITQVFRIVTIQRLKALNDSSATISWSMIEINLGVLVACIPTYAPLIAAARDRMGYNHRRTSITPPFPSWPQRAAQKSNTVTRLGETDNDSEEAMVTPDRGIQMTTKWTQVVEDRDKV